MPLELNIQTVRSKGNKLKSTEEELPKAKTTSFHISSKRSKSKSAEEELPGKATTSCHIKSNHSKGKQPASSATRESSQSPDDSEDEPDNESLPLVRGPKKTMDKGSEYHIEQEHLPPCTHYASLELDKREISLTQFPSSVITGIRGILENCWGTGLKPVAENKTDYKSQSHVFKRSWRCKEFSCDEVVMRNILAYLASQGWVATTCPTFRHNDDSLTFQKGPKIIPQCYWLVISMRAGEKHLDVVGGSDELLNTIRLTLREMDLLHSPSRRDKRRGSCGNTDHVLDQGDGVHRFELARGSLRPSRRHEQDEARRKEFPLRMLERLEERGWRPYATAHKYWSHITTWTTNTGQTNSITHEYDEGTWYCVKSKEWTPDNPVKFSW